MMRHNLLEKCSALKAMLQSIEMAVIMEAHNGLSARIVEQTGFQGIWASGLSIATSMGVRDSNELSLTQNLTVLESMVESSNLPILFDGDTGYGNFNNARLLVRKLERITIAGVVIEDKLFPKLNSFIGERQKLAEVSEVVGKMKAMCDSRDCDDFQIIARVEALIAGHGMEEALRRATAYHEAGADAIFIHSKKKHAGEIIEFGNVWQRRCPLVIAPTTYCSTPLRDLEEAGISLSVCANQNMRAAVMAMKTVCRKIYDDYKLDSVEDDITPLNMIFDMMNYDELEIANRRYLPVD